MFFRSALKKHLPGIANVMMIGNKRKFVSAVFTLACMLDSGFDSDCSLLPASSYRPASCHTFFLIFSVAMSIAF